MTMLNATDIRKSFGTREVLRGISLAAAKGDVISMIGSSGSGKSTFLRCLNFLEHPTQGQIALGGQVLACKRDRNGDQTVADPAKLRAFRARVTMVFQQFNLWSHMTILQNVMEAPVTVLREDRAAVEARARMLLDKVGIGDKADAWPAQLSGGQQQRAAIARALCMQPKALLFDEPTSALDPELQQEVVRVIKDLAGEHRTMIIVTHDMRLAADVSDHVVFLHQGLIAEEGPPDQLFGAPKTDRLRQFLSASMAH